MKHFFIKTGSRYGTNIISLIIVVFAIALATSCQADDPCPPGSTLTWLADDKQNWGWSGVEGGIHNSADNATLEEGFQETPLDWLQVVGSSVSCKRFSSILRWILNLKTTLLKP